MKKTISFLVIMLIFLNCCENNCRITSDTPMVFITDGEHLLHKMQTSVESNSEITGGFFFMVGAMSGKSKEDQMIYFSWRLNDGTDTYVISKVSLIKTRIRLLDHPKDVTPTVQFILKDKEFIYSSYRDNPEHLLEYNLDYILITCHKDDWKFNVQLPIEN